MGNNESGFRFLGNSLEVHAEEVEPENPPVTTERVQDSGLEIRKTGGGAGLKERKRSNTEDDGATQTSQKVLCDLPNLPTVNVKSVVPGANSELVERAKSIVEKAIKQHKVYVMFGQYGTVKRGLKRRGWLEKPCDCCRISRSI